MIRLKVAVTELFDSVYSMVPAGQLALSSFITSLQVFTCSYYIASITSAHEIDIIRLWGNWGPLLFFCLFNLFLRYMYEGFIYDVAVRAVFLSAAFATGLYLTTYKDGLYVFGLYTMVLSFFHFSEFMAVALTNPKTLSTDSFILNHSIQYGIAAFGSWMEWLLEYYFLGAMKMYFKLAHLGLLLCITGEVLRKAAMFTASTSFTHLVQYERPVDHKLVTHGVYAWCRHPSYVGWFLWSIGTQILLLNPICTILYAAASWAFFNERIYGEEITLLTFYGKQYREYQSRVPTGLPFIQGFTISDKELDVAGSHVAGVKDKKPDHYSCGHSKVEHPRPEK